MLPEGLGQARPGNSHTLHWDWLLSSHSPVHPAAESSLVRCVLPPITSFHSFLGCLYAFGVCHWSCPWSLQDTSQLHRSDKTYETEVRVRSPTSQSLSSLLTQEGHPATRRDAADLRKSSFISRAGHMIKAKPIRHLTLQTGLWSQAAWSKNMRKWSVFIPRFSSQTRLPSASRQGCPDVWLLSKLASPTFQQFSELPMSFE